MSYLRVRFHLLITWHALNPLGLMNCNVKTIHFIEGEGRLTFPLND